MENGHFEAFSRAMNTSHPLCTLLFTLLLCLLSSAAYADDNITRITDRLDATKTVSFAYDLAGRLKRVTIATGAIQRTDYVFDGNGNRTKKLTWPLPTDPPSAATVETYQTGSQSNRLASIAGPKGTRSLTYDQRGNLTQESAPAA